MRSAVPYATGRQAASFVNYAGRQPDEVMGRHSAILGEAAGPHLPDQAAAPDPVNRINHHAIADRPVVHASSECCNLAREIDAHNARHRHLYSGHTAPREDIVVIQSRCIHAHEDFATARFGIGKIGFVADRARTAMLVDNCCFHGVVPEPLSRADGDQCSRATRPSALRSTLLVVASGSSAIKKTPRGCW